MSDFITDLGEALDKQFAEIVVNGEIAKDSQGNPIMDEEGEPLRVPPSAAMMGAAMKWYEKRKDEQGGTKSQDMKALAEAAASAPHLIQMPESDIHGKTPASISSLPKAAQG